ncbi:YlzJ-like family protein [Paenibacillus chartarius]|uniref:YlzJ-like family protein n=1 Tax=Paenibacillus chartarius TaxID=747481 RepID=A0ABV6DSQ8_9BACL
MIMYTPIPLELVFDGVEDMKATAFEANVGGVQMMLEPCGERQARIVRLLSPNPQDYLKPEHAPGTIVYMAPQFGEV